jgi:DNA-binding MarR family transcriptional regulator
MSTAAEIAEALMDIKRSMRQQMDTALQASGLSFARAKVLSLLDKLGPCRPGILAEHLRHAPRTLTDAIDALERDGLVRREPHPDDRRAVLVHLTEAGQEALKQAQIPRKQALEAVFAPLDTDEQAHLLRLLEKVRLANRKDN